MIQQVGSKVVLETGKDVKQREARTMQEKRETRGDDEVILRWWRGERRSMLATQRRWLERTRTGSENTKSKDQKDKRRRSRLEKSSDGRRAKWTAVALPFTRTGAGYLYAKLTRDSARKVFYA